MSFWPVMGGNVRGMIASIRTATSPELDLPDGDLSWERWLEARQRLETVLLFSGGPRPESEPSPRTP